MSTATNTPQWPEIDDFIDALWLEDGLSRNTLAAYRRDLAMFAQWLTEHRKLAIGAATEHDIQAYMGARLVQKNKEGNSGKATSANRRLTVFKRYFRWAVRRTASSPTRRCGSRRPGNRRVPSRP